MFLNLSCSFFFKQFSPLEVLKQTPLVKASPYPSSLFSLHFIISALYHPKLTQIKTRQYLWKFLFFCVFLNLSCSFFFKQFSPLEVLKQTPLVKASPYPSSLFCLHSPHHHFCSLPPKVSTNENKTIFMAISIILNCTF